MTSTKAELSPRSSLTSQEWLAAKLQGPMIPGSILVSAPSNAFQAPGGGEVQLIQTSRHLENMGLTIRPFNPWIDSLRNSKVLHLFGMSPEGLNLAHSARAVGIPVVLSSICWFEPAALISLAKQPWHAAASLGAWSVRRICPGLPGWRRALLQACDRILPNSEAEADQLVHLFGVNRSKIRVIPNGVELRPSDPNSFPELVNRTDFILYAGRIEPRKNVLSLAKAARAVDLPLVVIGDPVPGHEAYAGLCRKAGGKNATWLPRIEYLDPRLSAAYAKARVFALPSWFETPGLAALEAGLAGTPVVITPLGCTREYFGDHATYTHPGRPREIAAGLRLAWEFGKQPDLARWIGSRYLWAHAAQKTSEVYQELES